MSQEKIISTSAIMMICDIKSSNYVEENTKNNPKFMQHVTLQL